MDKAAVLDMTASVWRLILGPSFIMLTRAKRDDGIAACWDPGWKVPLKVLFLLNMSLRTTFAALARYKASLS